MEQQLSAVLQHPLVIELVEQNKLLTEKVSTQQLAGSTPQKVDLNSIKLPFTFKNRLLFQEGIHNGFLYLWDDIKQNMGQWENLGIHHAEHADASNNFVGISKNIRADESEKALYGDLEIINLQTAQSLAYQVLNQNGKMGLSPTLDIKESFEGGKKVARGPYILKSQSIVLNPAVKTTVFNSQDGGNNMSTLKDGEVAVLKQELDDMKLKIAKLADLETKFNNMSSQSLSSAAEALAKREVALGRIKEEELTARKDILVKMSDAERKVLADNYDWLEKQLEEKSEEETFLSSLPEGTQIPESIKAMLAAKKNAEEKGANELAGNYQPANAGNPFFKKKKMPFQPQGYQRPQMMGAKTQQLSEELTPAGYSRQNMDIKNPFQKFQNLSEEKIAGNQEFLDFVRANHRR